MCLIPNGDLFRALRSGKTQVVTEHIECFTPSGLRLKSGHELEVLDGGDGRAPREVQAVLAIHEFRLPLFEDRQLVVGVREPRQELGLG